jgi:hypothetical protein
MSKKHTVVLIVTQGPSFQEDHNRVTSIYFFMEFRFDDLNWDEFAARVLRLLFESVNYKKKLSGYISFCVTTFCLSLVTKCLELRKKIFIPSWNGSYVMSVFRHCICYGINLSNFRRNTLPPDSGRRRRLLVV